MFKVDNPYIAYCTPACIQDFNATIPNSQIEPNKTYFLRFDDDRKLIETDVPKEHHSSAFERLIADCLLYLQKGEHPQWEIDGDHSFLDSVIKAALSKPGFRAMSDYANRISIFETSEKLRSIKTGSTSISFFIVEPGDSFSSVIGHVTIWLRGIRSVAYSTTKHGAARFHQTAAVIEECLTAMAVCPEAVPELRKDGTTLERLTGQFYQTDIPTGRLADLFKSINHADSIAFELLKREVNSIIRGLSMDEVYLTFSFAGHPNFPFPEFGEEQKFQFLRSAEQKMVQNSAVARKQAEEESRPMPIWKTVLRGLSANKTGGDVSNLTSRELFEIDNLINVLRHMDKGHALGE